MINQEVENDDLFPCSKLLSDPIYIVYQAN